MRKLFFILLVFPFAFACSDKNEIPKEILPKKKMQEIIWDMTRAEEFLNGFVFYKDTSVDKVAESQKWYNKIYQIHGTTKAQFEKSYTYYQSHPELMKELLDSVSKRKLPIKPVIRDSIAIKDSIAKRDSLAKKDSISKKDSLIKITIPVKDTTGKISDTLNKRKFLRRKILKRRRPPDSL